MSDMDFMHGETEKSELDPSYSASGLLDGYDPNDTADERSGPQIVPFNDNIGVCVKGAGYTFTQSSETILKLTQKALEGPNAGLQFTLNFPAAPRYNKKVGTAYVEVDETDTVTRTAIRKEWLRGLARIVVAHGLPTPTERDLEDAGTVTAWAARAEGAKTVFGGYEDNNGFGQVRVMQNQQRKDYTGTEPFKYAIGVSNVEEPARDRKGEIPGLTRLDQAKAAIAKFEAKGK